MIRFFEAEDKKEISLLAADFLGEDFNKEDFGVLFDEIVDGSQDECGIAVLHAGEYLGYCLAHITEEEFIIHQLYIKPRFQKMKVAPQVFDFIDEHFPEHRRQAFVPKKNEIALGVFSKRGYDIIIM